MMAQWVVSFRSRARKGKRPSTEFILSEVEGFRMTPRSGVKNPEGLRFADAANVLWFPPFKPKRKA